MSDFFKENDCDMGLLIHEGNTTRAGKKGISLDKANRLLKERGTVVYGWNSDERPDCWGPKSYTDTHRALLINIEPIVKDSAEKIANDLADYKFDHEVGLRFREFVDRAKALKGEK